MAYGGYSDSDDNPYEEDEYYDQHYDDYNYSDQDEDQYDVYNNSDPYSDQDEDQYDDEDYDDNSPQNSDNDEPITRRSRYSPEISDDDIKALILREMAKQDVKVTDIPAETIFTHPSSHTKSKRYFEVKGFAWFTCKKSHDKGNFKRWPSAHAWCFIDLKKQKICYRDEQDCKKHNSRADNGPEFTEEALKRMIKYVVTKFLIRSGRKQVSPRPVHTETEQTERGPHDQGRCGKCRRLGRECWK